MQPLWRQQDYHFRLPNMGHPYTGIPLPPVRAGQTSWCGWEKGMSAGTDPAECLRLRNWRQLPSRRQAAPDREPAPPGRTPSNRIPPAAAHSSASSADGHNSLSDKKNSVRMERGPLRRFPAIRCKPDLAVTRQRILPAGSYPSVQLRHSRIPVQKRESSPRSKARPAFRLKHA